VTSSSGQAALDHARQVNSYPVGMCLKYVRAEAWQIGSLYGSAIDAWYGAADRHPGDRTPPLGAPLFYKGGQHGHVVICSLADREKIRGTDMPASGVVSEDALDWPVTHWGVEYLGWTGDLNGVDLPLGSEDDMSPEDWDKLRGIVRDEVQKNNNDLAERVWTDNMKVTTPAGNVETKAARQTLREVWQRIAKAHDG
jgi:hypothetical protein